MQSPAETLIKPFGRIWHDMATQANAWRAMQQVLLHTTRMPAHLAGLTALLDKGAADLAAALSSLTAEATAQASSAEALLQSQAQAVVYPGLVGAWAVLEASFDDLLKKIVLNDPDTRSKLGAAGIKTATHHSPGSTEWVDVLYRRLESKVAQRTKGLVVETHRGVLAAFGVDFKYPPDKSRVIEELNQVRNCILHSQGNITPGAASISPRLASYVGMAIPPSDAIFQVALTMLADYTMAWLAALIHSPYLRSGVTAGASNPFSSPAGGG